MHFSLVRNGCAVCLDGKSAMLADEGTPKNHGIIQSFSQSWSRRWHKRPTFRALEYPFMQPYLATSLSRHKIAWEERSCTDHKSIATNTATLSSSAIATSWSTDMKDCTCDAARGSWYHCTSIPAESTRTPPRPPLRSWCKLASVRTMKNFSRLQSITRGSLEARRFWRKTKESSSFSSTFRTKGFL